MNKKKSVLPTRNTILTILISLGLFGMTSSFFMNCKKKHPQILQKKAQHSDNELPVIEFIQIPKDHREDQKVIISISVSDPSGVASIQCGLDETLSRCETSHSEILSGLSVGTHRFTVVATNNLGLTRTLAHSWNVTTSNIICDPFTDSPSECPHGKGLVGNLYYLDQATINSSSIEFLNNVRLDDYLQYGSKIENPVYMNQVDVLYTGFTNGFTTSSGETLQNQNGQRLIEWFSIRFTSSLLPNRGNEDQSYEFAIQSDDGMRVLLDGEVILEDDGLHVPRWKCTQTSYEFSPSMRKPLEIHYFQGPGNALAMRFFYRVAGSKQPCPSGGVKPTIFNWQAVPQEFFVIDVNDIQNEN